MIVQSFVSATGSLHSASPSFLAHVERPCVRWTGYGFCRTSSWSHSEDMIGKSWFPREGKRRKGANDDKCICSLNMWLWTTLSFYKMAKLRLLFLKLYSMPACEKFKISTCSFELIWFCWQMVTLQKLQNNMLWCSPWNMSWNHHQLMVIKVNVGTLFDIQRHHLSTALGRLWAVLCLSPL